MTQFLEKVQAFWVDRRLLSIHTITIFAIGHFGGSSSVRILLIGGAKQIAAKLSNLILDYGH